MHGQATKMRGKIWNGMSGKKVNKEKGKVKE